MLKISYQGIAVVHVPTEGLDLAQLRAAREIVADRLCVGVYDLDISTTANAFKK